MRTVLNVGDEYFSVANLTGVRTPDDNDWRPPPLGRTYGFRGPHGIMLEIAATHSNGRCAREGAERILSLLRTCAKTISLRHGWYSWPCAGSRPPAGKSFLLFAIYIPFATMRGVQPSLFFASTCAPF